MAAEFPFKEPSRAVAKGARGVQSGQRRRQFNPEAFLARLELIQAQLHVQPLTDKILRAAKRERRM